MQNFKVGRDREYKYYHALTAEDKLKYNGREVTHIKICMEYTKGGMNYFSGKINPRGYRITTRPVSRGEGMHGMESYTLLGDQRSTGGYVMVEDANKYNARRLLELAEKFDSKVALIAQATIDDDITLLRSLIQGNPELIKV